MFYADCTGHACREVSYWRSLIHKLKAPALEQLARDGKQWQKEHGAMLAANSIPERLASALPESHLDISASQILQRMALLSLFTHECSTPARAM